MLPANYFEHQAFEKVEVRATLPIDKPNLGVLFGLQDAAPDGAMKSTTKPRMKVILLKRDPPRFETGPLEMEGVQV